MQLEQKLQVGLLLIRITTGIFFLIWSIEKLVHSEITQKVFSRFYMMEILSSISLRIGVLHSGDRADYGKTI